jgi:hypothetical protein
VRAVTPDDRTRLLREALRGAEAVEELRLAGVVRPVPTSILQLTHRQVFDLARQGYAMFWLLHQLSSGRSGNWAAWPDKRLSDRLKVEPPHRLREFATELGKVGIHDLDELLLPDAGPDPELLDPDGDGGGS